MKVKYLILPSCDIPQEFEIEVEGSQYLRILCYEKCYDKSMLNKDDNEIVDKMMGKGKVQVRRGRMNDASHRERRLCGLGGDFPNMWLIWISCLASVHIVLVLLLWPLMTLVGLIVWKRVYLRGGFPCVVVRNVIKVLFRDLLTTSCLHSGICGLLKLKPNAASLFRL